jgi:DNA-binding NarL/FixJ family response regulator
MNKVLKKRVDKIARKASPARKRIFLVDDHPVVLAGLTDMINGELDMVVSCEAKRPDVALSLVPKVAPDIVLTDLTMPGRGGIEFIKDLIALCPALLILVISMHDEDLFAERCLRAGARGYVMKEAGSEELLTAIRCVLGGEIYVSPGVSQGIMGKLSATNSRGSKSPIQSLSDREFEVLQLVGRGQSNRQIAARLHLSRKTIDAHRSHIRKKLGLTDATALLRYSIRWLETLPHSS